MHSLPIQSLFSGPHHRRRGRACRGSSLLLVLWAIMFMSFAVIGLVKHLQQGLDESIEAEKEFRARLLLQSARTIAAHPAITRGDPLLRQWMTSTTSYEISLSTEGSRVAINQLGSNERLRRMTGRLFEKWGLDSRDAAALVESISDWIDADDNPHPNGAERSLYLSQDHPDWPYNKPFGTLDDVLMVRGADVMDRKNPGWRGSFTLYGDGTLDVHTAPSQILEALFDVTSTEVSRLIRTRNGPDGLPDTEDDYTFKSLPEVRSVLDVPERNYRRASSLLTLAHPVRRTECLARAGNLERRLTVLNGPGLLLIKEE
ncbi:MAG: ral secretion pathway protein GspK [Verrucomicrobiales bacterium]|nr:ral secretion pathway protein GspK [Verrucomicrobiales bacterium]